MNHEREQVRATTKAKETPVRSAFSNPALRLVAIVGSLASLISVPLALYFYVQAREQPQLTYYGYPVKAVIVKAGQASKLKVSFQDKEITTDISTAQVAIWNAGKQAIRTENILKPVILYTTNKSPILEATIRKVSRDVTKIELDTKDLQQGRVTLSWAILENNDGCVIQLIYAGGADTNFNVDGIVQGQSQIAEQRFSEEIKSPEQQYASISSDQRFSMYAGAALGVAYLVGIVVLLVLIKRRKRQSSTLIKVGGGIVILFALIVGLGSIVFAVRTYLRFANLGPPFGF